MNVTRTPMNAVAIHTATQCIEVSEGQKFYETPKAIELWQEEPELRFLKRWSKGKQVLWVTER